MCLLHLFFYAYGHHLDLHSFPTRRSSDLRRKNNPIVVGDAGVGKSALVEGLALRIVNGDVPDRLKTVELWRSEEHTSELQSRPHLVCRLLLEKKKQQKH